MSEAEINKDEQTIPFYPDHVRTEFWVTVGTTVIVLIVAAIGLLRPVSTGEPADPLNTPAHVKPEWYFLALYQLLKFIPKNVGAVFPVIAMVLLTIWPFLDRKKDRSRRIYWIRTAVVAVALIVMVFLTIWGEVS
jgi:quinol-cytochrome oxidoreductase complex cytochrome b subunit